MARTFSEVQTPSISTLVATSEGSWSSYITVTSTTKRGEHKRAVALEAVLEWNGYVNGISRIERWSVLRTTMTTNRAGTFVVPSPLEQGTLKQVTAAMARMASHQAKREQRMAIEECTGALCS